MDSLDWTLGLGGFALPFLGADLGGAAFRSGEELAKKKLPSAVSPEQVSRLRDLLSVPRDKVRAFSDITRYGAGGPPTAVYMNLAANPRKHADSFRALNLLDLDTSVRSPSGRSPFSASDLQRKTPEMVALLRHPSQDVAALAHELGHSTRVNKGLTKALRDATDLVARPVSSSSPRGFKFRYPLAAAPLIMDSDSPYLYAPAAAIAATDLPLLVEEGLASKNALRALKRMSKEVGPGGISKDQYSTARRVLTRMFGSYALPAAGMAAGSALIAALRGRD